MLTDAELARAGDGGRRVRKERAAARARALASKPAGHLAIIERPTAIWGPSWLPMGRIHRGVELRALTAAELAAAGPGGRWLRRERRRRARALLLGALELRWSLLQCFPSCRSSLWSFGVPFGGGFSRGSRHIHELRKKAFRRWW